MKPNVSIRKTAPMSDTGIATIGISTARKDPRKRKITQMTMRRVSVSVESTSLMASWMYAVESYGIPTSIPAGSCARMSGISARTRLMTSSAFALGSTQMPMNVAAWPLNRTSES